MGPAMMHLANDSKCGQRPSLEYLVFPSLPFAFGPDSDVFRDDGPSKAKGDRLHTEPRLLAQTLESHEGAFLLEGWETPAMGWDAEAPSFGSQIHAWFSHSAMAQPK